MFKTILSACITVAYIVALFLVARAYVRYLNVLAKSISLDSIRSAVGQTVDGVR